MNRLTERLSEHFTLEEMTRSQTAERCHIDNTPDENETFKLRELCLLALEEIRAKFGVVMVSSGFRCAELSERIGSTKKSQHGKGEACDFTVIGATPTEVCRWIVESGMKFDQLIDEGRWVHISYNHNRNRGEVLTAHFQKGLKTTYTFGLDD